MIFQIVEEMEFIVVWLPWQWNSVYSTDNMDGEMERNNEVLSIHSMYGMFAHKHVVTQSVPCCICYYVYFYCHSSWMENIDTSPHSMFFPTRQLRREYVLCKAAIWWVPRQWGKPVKLSVCVTHPKPCSVGDMVPIECDHIIFIMREMGRN